MKTALGNSLRRLGAALLLAIASPPALAERLPVLGQIDLPHPYYYREMYLPQLTSGPSSLAWSADSRELAYSMGGSLWRQAVGGGEARELTTGCCDYQPDWSADGRWIVYSSYRHDAMELWVLDLRSGRSSALLANGAVNVEPRFSPDGTRIAFVSTAFNRHFHIFVGDFADGRLTHVRRVSGETTSALPRYYYGPVDLELSPVWSRDGRELLYVSNRNHIYGTGGFWRAPVDGTGPGREIHFEETTWRARPDLSPDGSRIVYASYAGRQWHNLWILPAQGGDALPLSFADWDQWNARWSPDGGRLAFIANRTGNTEIDTVNIPGGEVQTLTIAVRHYLYPVSRLHLALTDREGRPAAARVSILDGTGGFHAPADHWIRADDGFDRAEREREAHYFHLTGDATLDVPAGRVTVEVMRGFERPLQRRTLEIAAGQTARLAVAVDEGAWSVPAPGRWVSADLHVHMNYGGTYRNSPKHLVREARGEALDIVESLIVNKEQRFPDIAYDGVGLDPASRADTLVVHGQEFHTSYWGHLGLIGINGGIILPGYAGYPGTAASSLVPTNADVADRAHARGALVGYVHPYDTAPDPYSRREPLTHELPADVALGKVDYMEIVGFSDHRATAQVWYRLLNLGFRIPAGAGTDAMSNFASLRGPVGMNRVYARIDGPLDHGAFLSALKSGRTFATNGPLLGLTLGEMAPGDELVRAHAGPVAFSARLRSIVPVDHLELVCNGHPAANLISGRAVDRGDFHGTVQLTQSGWCVLRASTDQARYPVLDNYVYATTSPVYVSIAGAKPRSPADARFFLAWIDRLRQAAAAYPDWNNAAEKSHVAAQLAAARAVFARLE